MDYTDINTVNIEDVKLHFQKEREYTCVLPFITRNSEIFLSHILRTVLEEVNQGTLHSHLEYALNELSMNASKANSKRLYFESKDLDIHNHDHYKKGLENFKEDVFIDFSKHEKAHFDSDSFVRINLHTDGTSLLIDISNNSPLVDEEKLRIAQRLKSAHKFENLTDVLSHGFDASEGGGFGLIIIVLMLRKINIDEKALVYRNEENGSVTSIKIPLNILTKEHSKLIADEIASEIIQMPQFPESIVTLQRELSDPNCSFESIADTISSDLTLTAEIMRIANSPVYMGRNKVTDITGAVRLIGMLGVKSVLYNYGVNKVLTRKYNKDVIKEINDHSFHVALLASFLAGYKKLGPLAQDIYVAALLHDVGKIIVKSLKKDLEIKLEKLCKEKHIPISILDDLTEGFNHSLIGAEVARKWNFPEKYINTIAYHHIPLEVDEEYKVLTYAVYLSNEIYHYNQGERDFNDLNYMVLSFFGIEQEEAFHTFIDSVSYEGLGA